MIPFFRKIRWRLAQNNQFFKYSTYAIGEILLIVFGIIIALQLQNWNENRKQNHRFKIVLEQIYNSVNADIETFEAREKIIGIQTMYLDTLLFNRDFTSKEKYPSFLYLIAQNNHKYFNSESNYHLAELEYNPNIKEQNELARLITLYVENNNLYKEKLLGPSPINDNSLWEILKENNIPFPGNMSNEIADNFIHVDEVYYSNEEIERTYELISDPRFNSELKSVFNTMLISRSFAKNRYEDAVSIRKLIKNYYPEIKIIFRDVGIIGSALDGYIDTKSRPLIQTDVEKNIWETELILGEGSVKFRCRDSWSQNWGGNSFPEGKADWNGVNIEVIPGHYHITLDLDNNIYSFIKMAGSQ